MNYLPTPPANRNEAFLARSLSSAAILSLLAGLVAVSSQSLWIDEANSAIKAISPNWSAFVSSMLVERGSDLQMPIYMVMLWGWEKVFGSSEFALRTMNIPFFVAAIGIVIIKLKQPSITRMFFVLFACSSAIVWAYLDEVRPYMLQFFAATLLMVPAINTAFTCKRPSTSTLTLFCIGILFLCASSLLGVIFAFFYGAAFLIAWLRTETIGQIFRRRDVWFAMLWFGMPLLLLAAYYAWTLGLGAKASGVGSTNAVNVVFCLYEILGFHGLGSGRIQLRQNPIAATAPFLPYLALYASVLFLFVLGGLSSLAPLRRFFRLEVLLVPACVVGASACAFLVGLFGDFRVVGRHFMPAAPLILLGFAVLAQALWNHRSIWTHTLVVSLLALMFFSAVAQRTATRHSKDDYRAAAEAAHTAIAKGGVVWWAADRAGANFYKVFPQASIEMEEATVGDRRPSLIFMANNRSLEYFERLPRPALVILSKPDIYDADGKLRKFLATGGYMSQKQLAAFTLYSQSSFRP